MSRVRARLPELVLVGAIAILFHRLLLGEVLFWGTLGLQFYPWRELAFGELRQGRLPLWNALVGNGAPLLANYQTGVFYPPYWLDLVLPSDLAMGWVGMLHLLWAGLGMMAFLRRMRIDRLGQGVGALGYALGGYLVSRFGFLSITSAAAWLPWLLWTLDGLWTAEDGLRWRRTATLGAIVGTQLLAGHAQTTFYSLILAAAYATWQAVRQGVSRRLALALGGVLLGVALAAIQLLPTLELLNTSQRSGGVETTLALTYSYWPWRGLSWLAPNLFGSPATGDYWGYGAYWEDATFAGVVSLLLAGIAVVRWMRAPRDDAPGRAQVPFFVLTVPPVVVLALGQNTPVFVWLFEHVPTFDLFQAPARWMLLAVFAVAVLAGIGAHGWSKTERGLFWTRLATAGGGSALVIALAAQRVLQDLEPSLVRGAARLGLTIIGIGALILLQPAPGARRRWIWEGAALALLATELVTAHWGLNPTIDRRFYTDTSPMAGDLAVSIGEARTLYLPQDEYAAKFNAFLVTRDFGPSTLESWTDLRHSLLPNLGMLDGVPSANNFEPMRVGPHDILLESTRDARLDDALPRLRAMNVGVLLATRPVGNLESIAEAGTVSAYAVPDTMPRAYLVGQAIWVDRQEDALSAVSRADFDPASVVVLEGNPETLSGSDAPFGGGTATITQAEHTMVEVAVDTAQDGWLVLVDSWYPGWQATLDGEPAPILRANVAFRAVRVPAGVHTVAFRYRPASLRWGALVSALGLVALGILATRR